LSDEIIRDTPLAHGAAIIRCPVCSRPHLVLFDENGVPLYQYIVPKDGFMKALITALES
jgi:hypothetical protein